MSAWLDLSFVDIPTFMTRLVEDSGWIMNGRSDHAGRSAVAARTRSCTRSRAWKRSVPGLKISWTEERSETDLDRITSSPSIPLSASSIGTVTRPSTSAAESPRHRVWTSTRGGANSGKTSIGMPRNCATPKNIINEAATTTRKRSFRLVPTIQRIMAGSPVSGVQCPVSATFYLPTPSSVP